MKAEPTQWQIFHDLEAAEYDQLCFTQNTAAEVEFIIDILNLSPGNSILDVGCGTGRHAVELARKGFSVTGIDLSSGMLEQARSKATAAGVQLELIHADATDFSLAKPFDAAICICEGSFGLLGEGDHAIEHPLAILRNIHRSMKPGARALFTVLSAYKMIRERTQDDVDQKRFDPLTLSSIAECSPCEGQPVFRLRERAFTPTEIRLLFQMAGLKVLNIWGGTAGNWGQRPIDLDEFELMIVAMKPE